MNERQEMWRTAGRYSTTGLEMALSVAVGSIGGHALDDYLGTDPWLLWIGIVIGFMGAIRSVLRVIRQYKRDHTSQ